MAEKDDRQNWTYDSVDLCLGFLLDFRIMDIAPAPGTAIAQWRLSNEAINDTNQRYCYFRLQNDFHP
jgi:hypothetical protein